MKEIVYLNGILVPPSLATISPFDHGFLYGYGLFETMRSYGGVIFRLERHLSRLYKAAESLGIHSQLLPIDLEKACYDVMNANNLTDARLRLTVSAGEGDIIPNPSTCKNITVFIVARKLVPMPPESYEKGFKAIVSSLRRNSQSPLSRLKTSCYLENIMARQEAKSAEADEAILLNEAGLIAEGSSSNIFCASKDILLTPSLNCGALPGITRETVLELAQALDIRTIETEITPEALLQADEAFCTNSIIEIMPLTYVGDKPIGSGKPGTLTIRLSQAYQKLVASSLAKRTG
jgi:branched-chain amino acid aminotransferase